VETIQRTLRETFSVRIAPSRSVCYQKGEEAEAYRTGLQFDLDYGDDCSCAFVVLGIKEVAGGPADRRIDDTSPANNGPSWWGAFAKNLFSWKNFTDEFKQGGCVNVFGNATAGALNPFSPSLSSVKSSVVRSMVADANATAASGGLMSLDLALAQGFGTEMYSMATGGCH